MQMYRDVADAISCSPKHYVDDNDLNALAMYTQRSVYIVLYGNCNVRVICDDAVSAVPDVQQLSAVCFPDKIIVIEFIDHNSFPRPGTGSNSELTTHPRKRHRSLFQRPRPSSTGGRANSRQLLRITRINKCAGDEGLVSMANL